MNVSWCLFTELSPNSFRNSRGAPVTADFEARLMYAHPAEEGESHQLVMYIVQGVFKLLPPSSVPERRMCLLPTRILNLSWLVGLFSFRYGTEGGGWGNLKITLAGELFAQKPSQENLQGIF